MIALHPTIYGITNTDALQGQEKLKAWLNGLSPRQVSLLRSELHNPTKYVAKPMTKKAQATIEAITGFSPSRQSPVERPSWGLAIKA